MRRDDRERSRGRNDHPSERRHRVDRAFQSQVCTVNSGQGCAVGVWAHEFGHTLGLNEHTAANNAVMWPYRDRVNSAPTSVDSGPTPACSGANARFQGVKCIYNYNG